MAKTVIGFFDDAQDAQRAVQMLQQNGISSGNIDFSTGGSGSAYQASSSDERHDSKEDGNAITRFFHSLFGDDSDDARKYSSVGARSNYIVTVHASSSDEAEDAADILDDAGAIDVDERAASYSNDRYDLTSDTTTSSSSTSDRDIDTGRGKTGESINRMEEELQVDKREVETGRVRVRSRVIETPVEEHVRLRHEHVNIERIPVDRAVSADDVDNFRERDIELTERAEVPVVNKEARVVEEIRVNKEVEERDEVVRDTVRRTDVDVDEDRSSKRNINNLDSDSSIDNTRDLDTDRNLNRDAF